MHEPEPTEPAERSAARILRELLIAVIAFAVAWSALDRFARHEHPDRTDEPEWIAMSILHWRQFVLGEPPAGADLDAPEQRSDNPWKQGVQRTVFGYMNPCLPKLILGGVLHAGGFREAEPETFQIFHRERPAAGRRARSRTAEAMPLARRVIQSLAALSTVLVLFIGRRLTRGPASWVTGLLAGALFVASPLVLHTATYIRTDFFMLPFALAGLLLALHLRKALAGEHGAGSLRLAAVWLGVVCGLAVSSKLNGALLCVALALWLPLLWLGARRRTSLGFAAGPLVGCLVAGACACAVFYALDPRLWAEPIEGVRDILGRWGLQKEVQQGRAEGMNLEVARSLGERFGLFLGRTTGRDDPWRSLTGLPGGTLLSLAGLALLGLGCARGRARACVALVFVVVFLVGTALWLPIDWERFFLPAAPCVALLQALAPGSLVELVLARRSARAHP